MAGGRPRAFDVDEVLDHAIHVFWRKGYEGASLSDLTQAMRINPPSLYAAFGSKEGLFRRAVDRYEARTFEWVREALEAPTARAVIEKMLRAAADWHTDPRHPRGCLLVQGVLACGDATDSLRRDVNARRAVLTATLRRRFDRARSECDLPADSDPAALARYAVTLIRGMAVEAAGGASRKHLHGVVDIVLAGWPGPGKARRDDNGKGRSAKRP